MSPEIASEYDITGFSDKALHMFYISLEIQIFNLNLIIFLSIAYMRLVLLKEDKLKNWYG